MSQELELPGVESPDLTNADASGATVRVLAGNAAANLFRQVSAWVLVLLLPPLLVRTMSHQSYATWILILQLGGYVGLVDSALQGAVGRFVANAHSRNDRKSMSQMVSSALVMLLAAAALACVALSLIAWKLPVLLQHGAPQLDASARRALLIVGLSYAITLPSAAIAGIFLGLQKNSVLAIAGTISKTVSAVGIAWAALNHMGLVWMAALSSIGVFVQPALFFMAYRRLKDRPRFSIRTLQRGAMHTFATFCVAIALTQLTSLLISGLDIPIVAAFDFGHAAYYAVAITVSNMLLIPFSAILNPLMPVAAGVHATSTPRHLGDMLLRTTRYATCILTLLALFLALAMQPLLVWWVKSDYAQHSLFFAELLVGAQFVRLTLMPYALMAFSAGQQRQTLASPIGEGLVNLACSLAGASLFGAAGVALGTLAGAFAGLALHLFASMRRTTALQFARTSLLIDILRPVALSLPSIALYVVATRFVHSNAGRFAAALGLELLAVVLLYRLALDNLNRTELGRHLRSLLRRSIAVVA